MMLLLGMIVIFNPEFPNLHNRDAVKSENQKYKRVLKRFVDFDQFLLYADFLH